MNHFTRFIHTTDRCLLSLGLLAVGTSIAVIWQLALLDLFGYLAFFWSVFLTYQLAKQKKSRLLLAVSYTLIFAPIVSLLGRVEVLQLFPDWVFVLLTHPENMSDRLLAFQLVLLLVPAGAGFLAYQCRCRSYFVTGFLVGYVCLMMAGSLASGGWTIASLTGITTFGASSIVFMHYWIPLSAGTLFSLFAAFLIERDKTRVMKIKNRFRPKPVTHSDQYEKMIEKWKKERASKGALG